MNPGWRKKWQKEHKWNGRKKWPVQQQQQSEYKGKEDPTKNDMEYGEQCTVLQEKLTSF